MRVVFQIDFMERAKRNEEIPLLLKQQEEDSEAQRQFWEQQETERVSHHNGPHYICYSFVLDTQMLAILKQVGRDVKMKTGSDCV